MSSRYRLFLIFIFVFATCKFAFASEQQTNEPVVTIKEPASYKARQILLFPLNIPALAVKLATIPVGVTLDYVEKKHITEKVANALSNKEKTFWVYPILEGGAGSNFGGGFGIKHFNLFHKNYHFNANYRTRINLDQYSDATFSKVDAFYLLDKPVSFRIDNNVRYLGGADYYGIGRNSKPSDHAKFEYTYVNTIGNLNYEFAKNFFVKMDIGFIEGITGNSNKDGYKSVSEMFDKKQLGSLGDWLDYFVAGLEFEHDTTDDPDFPDRGGIQMASIKRYEGINLEHFNYIEYEMMVKHFINLFKPHRTLVLHAGWIAQQETQNSKIPFYRLATIDNSSPVRGFPRFRFQDRNSVVFNIEYRMPVWKYVIGAVFYDMGQVFRTPADFTFDDMKYSGGMAMYLHAFETTLFNLTVAYGGEGVNVMFGMSKPL